MMLVALALLNAQPVQPAPSAPAAQQDEIRVVGQRLRNWRGQMSSRNGSDRCITLTSSGDAEIDRIGCSAMAHCYAIHRAGINEAATRRGAARNAHPVYRLMGVCVRDQRDLLVAGLAERRYRARQGN
jgi:hypothetical protein